MAISQELNERIEKEMAALTEKDYERAGMSYNNFTKELTKLIAQAKEDKEELIKAKFDANEIPYYDACFEKLALEHAHRYTAENMEKEVIKEFNEGMPKAELAKKILMAMGRFVIIETDDKDARKIYKYVRKGQGNVDTLNDVITMSQFGKRFFDVAKNISPGCQEIDNEYLEAVENGAIKLLKLVGLADAASDETKKEINRLRQIVTLCIKIQKRIKLYADNAFLLKPDHYSKNYASEYFRKLRKNNDDIAESEIEDLEVEKVPESDKPEDQPV